jgi:PleD family two-component response regulator
VAERMRSCVETLGAVIVAKRILREIERARIDRRGIATGIGVASCPKHAVGTVSPIQAAEDALCMAKRMGKSRVAAAAGAMAGLLPVEEP